MLVTILTNTSIGCHRLTVASYPQKSTDLNSLRKSGIFSEFGHLRVLPVLFRYHLRPNLWTRHFQIHLYFILNEEITWCLFITVSYFHVWVNYLHKYKFYFKYPTKGLPILSYSIKGVGINFLSLNCLFVYWSIDRCKSSFLNYSPTQTPT